MTKLIYGFLALFFSLRLLAAYQQLTVRNDYTSIPVTTSAFVQLVASTLNPTNFVSCFDSSGQTMGLYTGAVGQEILQTIIPPGGGDLPFPCSSGSRISIKAISANATTGELDLNFH